MTEHKRALITGGAGFIGLHLTRRLLSEGWQVDLLDNFSRGVQDGELRESTEGGNVGLIHCDVLDRAALAAALPAPGESKYGLVFHFAAIIGVANVLNRPYAVLRDNVGMHANMIEFAQNHPSLRRFVFASTSEVYAGTLAHFILPVPTSTKASLARE